MTILYLIRHGETDWNVEGRWQGQADVPLNARGYEQAEKIARDLKSSGIQAIYTSDLVRARQTAEILAKATSLKISIDARLREINQGLWQGMLVTEIQERYKDDFQRRRKNPMAVSPPGGETVQQVQERVLSAMSEILAIHSGQSVAVVSHGFAIGIILVHYLGVPIEKIWDLVPKNGEIHELEITDI